MRRLTVAHVHTHTHTHTHAHAHGHTGTRAHTHMCNGRACCAKGGLPTLPLNLCQPSTVYQHLLDLRLGFLWTRPWPRFPLHGIMRDGLSGHLRECEVNACTPPATVPCSSAWHTARGWCPDKLRVNVRTWMRMLTQPCNASRCVTPPGVGVAISCTCVCPHATMMQCESLWHTARGWCPGDIDACLCLYTNKNSTTIASCKPPGAGLMPCAV